MTRDRGRRDVGLLAGLVATLLLFLLGMQSEFLIGILALIDGILFGRTRLLSSLDEWIHDWRRRHKSVVVFRRITDNYADMPEKLAADDLDRFVDTVFKPFVREDNPTIQRVDLVKHFHAAYTHRMMALVVSLHVLAAFLFSGLRVAWTNEGSVWQPLGLLLGLVCSVSLERYLRRPVDKAAALEITGIFDEEEDQMARTLARFFNRDAVVRKADAAPPPPTTPASTAEHDVPIGKLGTNREVGMHQNGGKTDRVSAASPDLSVTALESSLSSDGRVEYRIAQALLGAQHRVLIYHPEVRPLEWWHLIPSVLYCRSRGIPIDLVVSRAAKGGRYDILNLLGCHLRYDRNEWRWQEDFSGVLVDPGRESADIIAIPPQPIPAWAIDGDRCRGLVAALYRSVEVVQESKRTSLHELNRRVLLERLKRVPEYSAPGVKLRVDRIAVADTRPMSKRVRSVALLQMEYLKRLYPQAGLPLYEPAMVELRGGGFSPVIPPVLEKDPSGYWRVHEGHSRLYQAMKEAAKGGPPEITAVLVENRPMPPKYRHVFSWEEVDDDYDPDYPNFEYIHSHRLESLARRKPGTREFEPITQEEMNLVKRAS